MKFLVELLLTAERVTIPSLTLILELLIKSIKIPAVIMGKIISKYKDPMLTVQNLLEDLVMTLFKVEIFP